jgi:hypothetical protein
MTLKERMEKVWQSNRIACPQHVTCWSENGSGWTFEEGGLRYSPGNRRGFPRTKNKGHSFLMKGYQHSWLVLNSRRLAEAKCTCSIPHVRNWWWCEVHGEVCVDID